ncbi:MAG: hypothetical protein ACREU6_00415 [Steroidobacteraceae bacterium]
MAFSRAPRASWYRAFREELPTLAKRLGLDPAGLTYADFDLILSGWLESRPVVR